MRTSLRHAFISLRENKGNVTLVIGTYLLEIFSIIARIVIVGIVGFIINLLLFVVLVVIGALTGNFLQPFASLTQPIFSLAFFSGSALISLLAFLFIFGPFLMSIGMLFFWRGGGNLFTRLALGARSLSEKEKKLVKPVRNLIMTKAPAGTQEPEFMYVLPAAPSEFNAFTIGKTIYLTSALVRSDYLAPLLAREICNLNNGNGRLTRALRYLVLLPAYWFASSAGQTAPGTAIRLSRVQSVGGCLVSGLTTLFSFLLSLSIGGFGLFLLNPFWVWFWRGRVFETDRFAFACGQGAKLIEYLENHQYLDVATPFFLSSLPYSEERIERLEELREIGGVAPETLRPTTSMVLHGVATALLAVIVPVLAFNIARPVVRQVAIRVGPTPQGVWQLTHLTYEVNTEPYQLASERGITTTLVLENGTATTHTQSSGTQRGSYKKVGYNTVQFALNSNGLVFGTEPYRIQKQGEVMILFSENQAFQFRQLNKEEVVALTPTTTPTVLPVAQLQEAIVGKWRSENNRDAFQFAPGGMLSYGDYAQGTYQFVGADQVRLMVSGIVNAVYYIEIRGDTLTLKTSRNDTSGWQLRAEKPLPTATPTITPTSEPTPTSQLTITRTPSITAATPINPTPTSTPVAPVAVVPGTYPTDQPQGLAQRILGHWEREDDKWQVEIRADGTFIAGGVSYSYVYSEQGNTARLEVTRADFREVYLVQMHDDTTMHMYDEDGSNLRRYYRVEASGNSLKESIVGRYFYEETDSYIDVRANGEYFENVDPYSWSLQELTPQRGVLTISGGTRNYIYNIRMPNRDIIIFEGYGKRYVYRRVS
jgi:Zn-dependent protease with chaperone function